MKPRRRRHVFGYGPRGVVACRRCGLERRFALVDCSGSVVVLYRQPSRSRAWTSEKPGCSP